MKDDATHFNNCRDYIETSVIALAFSFCNVFWRELLSGGLPNEFLV